MATYVNDLRLKEITTGDESGTWGTSTNTNLELIAEAFSYGTEVITTNADTHTTTIADGSTDPGRALYLKYTGTLDSACTITIGPNTVSKVWIVENGTSGSQNIILSQGSGANITIPAGDTKVVYSDGAGAGAAFFDAFASLSVVDLKVQDDLTVTDAALVTGVLTTTATQVATGGITSGSDIISDTDSTDSLGSTGVRWLKGWFDTLTAGTLTVGSGSVTDSSGAISFGDENLTTTGIVTAAGTSVFTNLDISGDVDVDGTLETDNLTVGGAQGTDGQVLTSTGSGVGWEAGGASDINGLSDAKTFGTSSIMLGDATTGTIDGANYNVGLGVDVFSALTSGDSNIAIGFDAAHTLTTGSFNVAIGTDSLGAAGAGVANNIMIGYNTGYGLTGDGNVAIGHTAFDAAGDRDDCVAIGNGAATTLTTGSQNVAIGTSALGLGTTANGNVCIGFLSASSLVGGSGGGRHNVSIGRESMEAQDSQEDNIAIGYQALHAGNSTSNSQNTIVGSQAGAGAHAGYGNCYFGYQAGSVNTSGIHNVFLGRAAGSGNTTGSTNILIGYGAGTTTVSGTGNVVLGTGANTGNGGSVNRIVLGAGVDGTSDNRITIGSSSNKAELDLNGSDTSWAASSDERLKENIQETTAGLNFINDLRPVTFDWKKKKDITPDLENYFKEDSEERIHGDEGITYHGFIAQETQAVIDNHPEIKNGLGLIKSREDGVLTAAPSSLVPVLVKAIQELSAEIEKLKGN
jgi:trimeric autotransporter adhesin